MTGRPPPKAVPQSAASVSYDPAWPAAYMDEAARLVAALGPALVALHHIGSTTVPGLRAKPIIDLLAEGTSLAAVDRAAPQIVALGYEAMGAFGIQGRRYFRKTDAAGRTHHLHAFEAGSPHVHRHLAFRDYLRAHPQEAAAYAALKIQLLADGQTGWDAY